MDYWAMIFFIITTLNGGYLREYIRNKNTKQQQVILNIIFTANNL